MKALLKSSLILTICILSIQVFSQTNDPVVMKIGKEEIKLSDFKNTYLKNNDLKKTSEQELRSYIDLFVNFRLKCAQADAMRLDTIQVLKEELAGYRQQAAEKYLTDKEVSDKLIAEALERMKWDIRASHILKELLSDALPADTLAAYNEIMKIRNRILKGESFAEVAAAESDDKSAADEKTAGGEVRRKGNGGDLGYFSAFDLIYSFENGAYNTAVGKLSMPVRSEFGYHLIYVQDRQPTLGKVKATQILIPFNKSPNLNSTEVAQDAANVEKKIKEVHADILAGMTFEDAVKKYLGENEKPGVLPLFGCNRFEGDFISGLYGVKAGDVSKPIKTSYGWHVVRIDESTPLEINDETQSLVKNKILRDSRSNKSKEAFIERVKKENNFKEVVDKKSKTTPIEDFYAVADTSLLSGRWNLSQAENLSKDMFSFAGKNYTQQDFAKYLYNNQFEGVKDVDLKILVNFAYRQFVETTVVDYEDARLEEKHPEFAALMKEYKDGILLYELSEQKVWKKAETDTIGLDAYYQTLKQNHLYPVRLQAEYYKSVDATITAKTETMLKKNVSTDKIMAKMNKKNVSLLVDTVTFWQGQNNAFDAVADWKRIDAERLFVNTTENELVRVLQVLQPSPKPLNDVKGVIVSSYQDVLEQQWKEDLHKNATIWVDYDAIMSLIK